MASDEQGEPVPSNEVFGDLRIAPLPEGTKVRAAFVLLQLDNGEWSARSVGDDYDRVTFLGALTSYTHGLRQDEANGWFEDTDPRT